MSVGQEKVVRHQELLKFILKLAFPCLPELLTRKVVQNRNTRAKIAYGTATGIVGLLQRK